MLQLASENRNQSLNTSTPICDIPPRDADIYWCEEIQRFIGVKIFKEESLPIGQHPPNNATSSRVTMEPAHAYIQQCQNMDTHQSAKNKLATAQTKVERIC